MLEWIPDGSLQELRPSPPPKRAGHGNRFSRYAMKLTGIPEASEETAATDLHHGHGVPAADLSRTSRTAEYSSSYVQTSQPRAALLPPADTAAVPWWCRESTTQVSPVALTLPEPSLNMGDAVKPSSGVSSASGSPPRQAALFGVVAAAAAAATERRALWPGNAPVAAAATIAAPAAFAMHASGSGDVDTGTASGGDTQQSTTESSGPLPLLSSMARSVPEAPPQPLLAAPLPTHSGCVTDTMALHTLDTNTEGTSLLFGRSPRHAQQAQHVGSSFAMSGNISETIGEWPAEVVQDAAPAMRRETSGHSMSSASSLSGCAAQAPLTGVGMSATDASFTDMNIRALMRQLDKFRSRDRFIGRFEMMGPDQRRRGGATCVYPVHAMHMHAVARERGAHGAGVQPGRFPE